ncbi:hypothetical protein F6464_07070 [Flavobacterium luteum]|uniref:Histidine kinase/HSP90-like ATPase domain-containing protein n=2 Tax=Flavobacterium luteum TaxID=2026654 RepID=A0A7J5AI67_9FLAO|nr:hypothetical protein F6464_07070 [Flavobacterium luteum]
MFYKNNLKQYIVIYMLFSYVCGIAQHTIKKNVYYLEGVHSKSLLNYLDCWKDSSDRSTIVNAANALKNNHFKSWKSTRLLYAVNSSKDLWVHLVVQNHSPKEKKYWWGIYTQSDTVFVYEKLHQKWFVVDTLDYSRVSNSRNIRTRFLATTLNFSTNPNKELLLQIKNKRHSSYVYFDITTAIDNLEWEVGFYWKIGILIGGFLIICIISILAGLIVFKKIFFVYAIYLFVVIQILLQEELFIAVFPSPIFDVLYRLNSLPLALISVSLHFLTTFLLAKLLKIDLGLKGILIPYYLSFTIAFGILFSLIYFLFMEHLGFNTIIYSVFWKVSYFFILLTIALNGLFIFFNFKKYNYGVLGGVVSLFFLCFNPASYFFNYLGFIKLYDISYPFYFYIITFSETVFLGGLIAFFYRNTVKKNYMLMTDKNLIYEKLLRNKLAHQKELNATIVETQEMVFENISQELHDNAGQQLSVINFQIENLKLDFPDFTDNLSPISFSIQKLSENLRQISHSIDHNYLSEKGLIDSIFVEVSRINENKTISFNLLIEDQKNRKFKYNEQIIIYRIFQESINNILKHAKATKVTINIITFPLFRLEIEDNGIGFDQKIKVPKSKSMGLKNCYNRAKIIGYDFEIESFPTEGTKILLKEKEK